MVKHLEVNGQSLPIRLSYRVFKGLKTEMGSIDLEKLGSLDPKLLETMLWYGLVSGHQKESKELKVKKEDMEDILDECMFAFLKLIPEFFPAAKVGNVLPNLENLIPKEQENLPSEEMNTKATT